MGAVARPRRLENHACRFCPRLVVAASRERRGILQAALKKVGVDPTFFVVKGAGHGFRSRPDLAPR